MIEIKELPWLAPRAQDAHKGEFGRVLVVAGAAGMLGAAVLTSEACLRAGAGLVTLGVPTSLWPLAMIKLTCAMTRGFAEVKEQAFARQAAYEILAVAEQFDIVALGPGIGQHPDTVAMVQTLLPLLKKPLVLDADGLNAVAQKPAVLQQRPAPTIVTPHPGEFCRLAGCDMADLKQNRLDRAAAFARDYGCIVVLKVAPTLVTDGKRCYRNTTGNPGMAKGGSGDVLTGVVAALLAQRLEPFAAAQLAVHVHGLAGDLACQEQGEVGLIATDIVTCLPKAFVSLKNYV